MMGLMMKLKTTKNIYTLLEFLMILFILLAIVDIKGLRILFIVLAGLTLVASAYLDYNYWRCPSCARHLGRRMYPAPGACKHCGHDFKDNDVVNAKELKDYFYGKKANEQNLEEPDHKHD